MKFLLIMNVNPKVLEALTDDERAAIGAGHQEFIDLITESGELISTVALSDPSASVTVAAKDGVPAATDGPYVEAKEFLGGYYYVDVENAERAVELAKLIPDTRIDGLAVEVRPVMFASGTEM